MKTMKCFISFLLVFTLLLPVKGVFASAEEKASIVNFDVTLNGILINNINNDYPLLVYKDITYFPLTWGFCRFMGLTSTWDQTSGLAITKANQINDDYAVNENTINQMTGEYSFVIPDYNITVNGNKINNEKEPWPFINFRGITYFPLTWKFAVDEFGWSYFWTQDQGLTISIRKKQFSLC